MEVSNWDLALGTDCDMGMGIGHQDWLDNISSAWTIGLGSEDMTLNRMNPDTGHLA